MAGTQPFAGEPRAVVVLPSRDPTLGGEARLLEIERAGFEAELGAPVELSTSPPTDGARWLLVLDPDLDGPPWTSYDPSARLLVSSAAEVGGLFEAMSLGRTAVREGGTHHVTDCASIEDVIARVISEVADTYPGFELRSLDWSEVCARHVEEVRSAGDPLPALQRWLAELEDGHTWAWAPVGNLPYALRVDGSTATFARVPESTAAHDAGVRAAWALVAIDGGEVDAAGWLARAAAPPHARQLIAGRRLLAGPAGTPRVLTARSPGGDEVSWKEAPGPPPAPLVSWTGLDARTGYLRIGAWVAGQGVDETVEAALAELRGRERLVLDLRGNPGGNLVLASRTRDRFLRARTELGSIRYSVGGGELSRPFPLFADPADVERWRGQLVVLTDALTFSSSEDFLLGLQGLEHVAVVGGPTGGGSGRPRALRLLPGVTLTISTALTFDRLGRCIEGSGIPADVVVSGTDEEVLAAARAL